MFRSLLPLLAFSFVSGGCASVVPDAFDLHATLQEAVSVDGDPLPTPSQALVMPAAGQVRPSLMSGVDAFAQATGLNVALDGSMRGVLEAIEFDLGAVEVPPDQVYPFFEGLLVRHGVYVMPVHLGTDEPTIALVRRQLHRDLDVLYLELSQEQARAFCMRHPATLVRVASVAKLDAIRYSSSARSLGSGTSFDMAISTGPTSLALVGSGRFVAGQLAFLEAAERGAEVAPPGKQEKDD